MTAEELSRPDLEFTVTSVPADLTSEEAEVVRDLAKAEQVTWGTAREMSGLEEVKTVMLAEPLESYTTFYQEMEAKGQHYSGAYSIAIMSVTIESDMSTATADFCSDTTNASLVSNDGQDMTSDGAKRRAVVSNEMVRTDSGWVLTSTEELGPC